MTRWGFGGTGVGVVGKVVKGAEVVGCIVKGEEVTGATGAVVAGCRVTGAVVAGATGAVVAGCRVKGAEVTGVTGAVVAGATGADTVGVKVRPNQRLKQNSSSRTAKLNKSNHISCGNHVGRIKKLNN
jgi:hypothetical protein